MAHGSGVPLRWWQCLLGVMVPSLGSVATAREGLGLVGTSPAPSSPGFLGPSASPVLLGTPRGVFLLTSKWACAEQAAGASTWPPQSSVSPGCSAQRGLPSGVPLCVVRPGEGLGAGAPEAGMAEEHLSLGPSPGGCRWARLCLHGQHLRGQAGVRLRASTQLHGLCPGQDSKWSTFWTLLPPVLVILGQGSTGRGQMLPRHVPHV